MIKSKIKAIIVLLSCILITFFFVDLIEMFINFSETTMNNNQFFTVWMMFSFFMFIMWALMMGDPGASETSDIIISIVCGILALPLSIILAFIFSMIEILKPNVKKELKQ